ncbi:hypothetical protein O7606_12730 [Micromonospora sp. WMMD882]|uniref:hypothetical protein n=1 Tax=Micromonospora sp. WMMD882 TaxID=3015151 RepID=UPI00248BB43C|nr:hypothetical protein [Micromonospora sp. WMMD882]WBB82150.1 hypothetical protein O7606_12730 [Micromonospora sp. WMMD882]
MTTVTPRRAPLTVILAAVVVLLVGLQAIARMYQTLDNGVVAVIVALIGAALYLTVAYGLWQGNHVAWILALIGGVLALLSIVNGDWLSLVTGLVLIVLLLLPRSRQWFARVTR